MDNGQYQSYQPYQQRGVPQGPPSDGRPGAHPAAHPESAYRRMRNERMYPSDQNQNSQFVPSSATAYTAAPAPPPHRSPYQTEEQDRRNGGQGLAYSQSMRTTSTVTPGVDNLGTVAAGGGISGIALGVAHTNERESGVDAMRGVDDPSNAPFHAPAERAYNTQGSDTPYVPSAPDPYNSAPLGGTAAAAGHATPGGGSPYLNPSDRSIQMGDNQSTQHLNPGRYEDLRYQGQSAPWGARGDPGTINPDDIADDDDDGFIPDPKRRSVLSIGRNSSRDPLPAAAGGAATGGVMGTIGGLVGRQNNSQDTSGSYGPVQDQTLENGGDPGEKSEWLKRQTTGNKKMMWIVGLIIGVVIVAAIVGGVVGGVLSNNDSSSGGSGKSAEDDKSANGDLGKDSSEIKDLMDNDNLHKVFPGMDYTAWGTQYPLCHKYPPSQNNVTRDIAVLSQLTNNVRIYGTDCNQTEMVLHAIDRLELKDMKLWLGVWLDTNKTTNRRQLDQLYNVLDETNDKSIFNGAIVGNEALFRAGNSIAKAQENLIEYMDEVRQKFKKKGIDMPIATSDLGDNWNKQLAAKADIVMANVHPFFAGVPIGKAADWTWNFWQEHNVVLTEGTNKKNIISEVGWPNGGGKSCGRETACKPDESGSVAGVDELNQFMEDWICPSLKNGTDYFWFEAFDEPWKESFNKPGMAWEDKWGLMDPSRKLKPGLKIPDCDGKTAS